MTTETDFYTFANVEYRTIDDLADGIAWEMLIPMHPTEPVIADGRAAEADILSGWEVNNDTGAEADELVGPLARALERVSAAKVAAEIISDFDFRGGYDDETLTFSNADPDKDEIPFTVFDDLRAKLDNNGDGFYGGATRENLAYEILNMAQYVAEFGNSDAEV